MLEIGYLDWVIGLQTVAALVWQQLTNLTILNNLSQNFIWNDRELLLNKVWEFFIKSDQVTKFNETKELFVDFIIVRS